VPSARTIARLLTINRNDLSKAETVTVAAVEAGVPLLVDARGIIEGFHGSCQSGIVGTVRATWRIGVAADISG
jgi:hypothetical protein